MEFEVDNTRLANAVTQLNTEQEILQKEYTKMYSMLEVLDSMWEGEAHDAYVATYSSDMLQMQAMVSVIKSIIEKLSEAREKYETTEQNVRSSIDQISI